MTRTPIRRLPLAALAALAAATVAAFVITQHLKVTTPLITGPQGGLATYGVPGSARFPATAHLIYPGSIPGDPHCPTSTTVYFQLLHHADSVQVTVVNARGQVVRTLAARMPARIHQQLRFTWNLREDDGARAPAGEYNFRLRLLRQRRTIDPLIPGYPITISPACSTP